MVFGTMIVGSNPAAQIGIPKGIPYIDIFFFLGVFFLLGINDLIVYYMLYI